MFDLYARGRRFRVDWGKDGKTHLKNGDVFCAMTAPVKCARCGGLPDKDGNDCCLGKLPGVTAACCGHGKDEGYIKFENGVKLEGKFRVAVKVQLSVDPMKAPAC